MMETRFASLQRLRTAHAALLGAVGDADELSEDQVAMVLDFLDQGSRTGQILHDVDSRTDAQSLLNYWTTILTANGHRFRPVLLDAFDAREVEAEKAQRPPYPGLNAFEREDSFLFFGREPLIRQMVERLRSGTRLLAVVGLSGSGKSSLVRAGLVPVLEQGEIAGSDEWAYPRPMIPGSRPLLALQETLRGVAPDKPALVVLDQFEEVFTAAESAAERQQFLDEVVKLATEATPVRYVVLTMRSEYDTYVEQHAKFKELFLAGKVQVAPLTEADLRKAIESPAAQRGVTFDPGLARELARQVLGQPAGLPLLQFTLSKLWETASEGRVRAEAYTTLGGDPREILRKTADATYEQLGEDKELTRQLFQALVDFRGGTEMVRWRRTRKDLRELAARDRVDALIEKWHQAGLLRVVKGRTPDEDMVDLSHETLIRNWQQLIDWANELREMRRRRLLLRARTAEWKERDKQSLTVGQFLLEEAIPKSHLSMFTLAPVWAMEIGTALWEAIRKGRVRWRDVADDYLTAGQLEEAEKYADLTEDERSYVARSREVVFAGQRLLSRVLTALVVIGFVLVGVSAWMTIRAGVEINRREAAVRALESEQKARTQLVEKELTDKKRQLEEINRQLSRKVAELSGSLSQEKRRAEKAERAAGLRPSLAIRDGRIEWEESKEWSSLREQSAGILRIASGVGQLEDGPIRNTAFVIARGVILTPAFGRPVDAMKGMFTLGDGTKGGGSRFGVSEVLARIPSKDPNLELMVCRLDGEGGTPVTFAASPRVEKGRAIYVIGGYAGLRLQPGYILSEPTGAGILADHASSAGSGGGPLVDARTNLVVGVHVAGRQDGSALGVTYARPLYERDVRAVLERFGAKYE